MDDGVKAFRHASGGGLVGSVVGVAVILFGGGMLLGPLTTSAPYPSLQLLIAVPFLLAGLGMLLGRYVFELAPDEGEARVSIGLVAPIKTWRLPLDSLTRVAITSEVRRSKNSTYTVYPVRVLGEGDDRLTVKEDRDFTTARRLGEQVARAANLPLHDHTAVGSPTVRLPEELDLSLRERLALRGDLPDLPEAAPDASVTWRLEADGATIELQAPDMTAVAGGVVGTLAIGFALSMVAMVAGSMLPEALLPWLVLAAGAVVVLGVAGVINRARRKVRLKASIDELVIERPGLIGLSALRVPAMEIEEIELDPHGVRIVTDRRMVVVGRPLSPAVRRWLRDALCAVVG